MPDSPLPDDKPIPSPTDDHSHEQPRQSHWRVWAWLLLLLFGLVLAPVIYFQAQVAAIPDIGEPFDVQAYQSYAVPDEENAFTLYREAAQQLVPLDRAFPNDEPRQDAAFESIDAALKQGWGAANADLRGWLELNRAALEIWRQGTERADAIEVPLKDVQYESIMPATQATRDFTRLAMLEAARQIDAGTPDAAWPWCRAALRCSRHVGMHAPIIGRIYGIALYRMAADQTLAWSANSAIPADSIRAAWSEIDAINELTPPFSENLKTEYLFVSRISEADFVRDAFGNEDTDNIGYWTMRITGGSERLRRANNLLFANWLSQCDRPGRDRPPLRIGEVELFELPPGLAPDPKLVPPQRIEEAFRDGDELFQFLGFGGGDWAPEVEYALDTIDREAAVRAALVLGLALQLHHRQHGAFPETLEPLVSDRLQALPVDPFGRGEPLRYRREADGNATIWSIGSNRTDDGGLDPEIDLITRVPAPAKR